MIEFAWNLPDEDQDPDIAGSPRPVFGSWPFLRAALRRGWRLWGSLAVLGALVAVAGWILMPPRATATASVLLARSPGTNSETAMATNLTLLRTRTVGEHVIARLGLAESPEDFQSAVNAEALSPEILQIDVKGVDDRVALGRAEALVDEYLAFRATQMKSLTQGLVSRYEKSITAMQGEVKALTAEYDALTGQGRSGSTRASEILSERTTINSQISTAQRAIEQATLETDAAITASHVIDPPHLRKQSAAKPLVLGVGSGLIAGTAIGLGLVVASALTSGRLWRRQEIAMAIGAPILVGVRSTGRPRALWRHPLTRLASRRRRGSCPVRWNEDDLEKLISGLEAAIDPHGGAAGTAIPWPFRRQPVPMSIGVAAPDNEQAGAALVERLGARLAYSGRKVLVLDLSASGALGRTSRKTKSTITFGTAAEVAPGVHRTGRAPGLVTGSLNGTRRAVVSPAGDGNLGSPSSDADIIIALVHVDPDLMITNLGAWIGQVVPLVTAGRNTAERLETMSEIIRWSGLTLPFAMLLGTDPQDTSLGMPGKPDVERDEAAVQQTRGAWPSAPILDRPSSEDAR